YSFKSDDYTDQGIPIIRIGDVGGEIDWKSTKKVTVEKITDYKKFLIKPNDILIAMTGATIGKTSVFKASKKALLNQRVGIIRANADYDERFLAYLINSSVFKAQVIFFRGWWCAGKYWYY